ncbi:DUF1761 domain-containing protein [Devosia lacusdianchii]|uniref:DUF1761 domain-containing protein n=1 Tax=Devosia lacusdianchii TaxID=2917991 RepID=UPI001F057CD2|nr:DUF1761 domain-containing protein [Devosia sp. JXJ CY 41]
MNKSMIIRIAVAAVAALICSAVYYGAVVGSYWRELSGLAAAGSDAMAPWQPIAQLVRNLAVAFALAYVLRRTNAVGLWPSLRVTLVLWFGFQAMAIAGSVIHEQYPPALYGIHVFDALMTVVVMTICLVVGKERTASALSNREVSP